MLSSRGEDGVIYASPLERKTAKFKEAMIKIEQDLRCVEDGEIVMRRKSGPLGEQLI